MLRDRFQDAMLKLLAYGTACTAIGVLPAWGCSAAFGVPFLPCLAAIVASYALAHALDRSLNG